MKKLLLSLLMGMMTLGAVAEEGKFTVTGTVKGQGRKAICAVTDAWGGGIFNDEISITDDKVDLSFDLEDVGWLMVYYYGSLFYMIPAVPGEAVTIDGEVGNYAVDGSALYKEYDEAMAAIRPLQDARSKYDFKQACRDEIAGKTSEQVFDLYQLKMKEQSQPVTDAVLDLIGKYRDHESSMLLLKSLNSMEELEKARELISEQVLNGRMNPYYEGELERVKRSGASNPLLGKPAPDFKLKDVNGKKLSLSSLRGKWVLLDFWYKDCSNAVSQFPILKMMYNKYKDQVEILGVDCIDEEQEWKTAVTTMALPWLNVLSDRNMEDPKSPMAIYGTTATPTYFLISPSGKVAMWLSSANDFMYMCQLLFD